MATEKQIQANRNNAKKSTGPRTEEGKSRVSLMAFQLPNGTVFAATV
jgi:hypothetical protein